MALLSVKNLQVRFNNPDGVVDAVSGINFDVHKGETLCIVGESGCGKSVTAQSILRLIPTPPGEIVGGEVLFNGTDVLKMEPSRLLQLRGNDIAMVFQDPMTSLNPVFTCGFQIAEAIRRHQELSRAAAWDKAVDMMREVRIADPHKRANEYPHQLSGGMRQRVMIAMALACDPKLLIADEPTTALDVTIQAQILSLMMQLKQRTDMGIIFITHDLGIVAEIADRVLVLYAGKVAEEGLVNEIYSSPQHPYTNGLLKSVPQMSSSQESLYVIPGTLPDPTSYKTGCRFYDRCPRHQDCCLSEPPMKRFSDTHRAACFFPSTDPQPEQEA